MNRGGQHALSCLLPGGNFRSTRIYALMQPNICVNGDRLAGELGQILILVDWLEEGEQTGDTHGRMKERSRLDYSQGRRREPSKVALF